MFSFINFKTKPFIGLDLYRDEIRFLALKTSPKGKEITAAGIAELPNGVIAEGRIKDSKKLQKALSRLIQSAGILSCYAAIGLPLQYVMKREIQFPAELTKFECDREIARNLSHYFPGVTEEVCYDFESLNDQEHQISLVAARQDLIYEYIHVVNQSGLNVRVVDVDSWALMRAVKCIHSSEVMAILEVHTHLAQLNVYQKFQLIFSQAISIIDTEFIRELKLTMQMYLFTCRHAEFDKLLLIGKKLSSNLIEQIKVECKLNILDGNFFSRFIIAPSCHHENLIELASHLWISLGLALRGDSQ